MMQMSPGHSMSPEQARELSTAVRKLVSGAVDYSAEIGPAWAQDNAEFEASNPGAVRRVVRAVNPLTSIGSGLGTFHTGIVNGDPVEAGLGLVSTIPMFAATKVAKDVVLDQALRQLRNKPKPVAKDTAAKWAGATGVGLAADVYSMDDTQNREEE